MGYSFYEDTKKDSGAVRKTALNTPQRPGSIDVKSLQIDVFPYDAFEFSDPGKIANPVLSLKDRWTFDGASIKVGSITADKIDVDSLFAQQITVPDGGRIRYETGARVQKRCVQLADEKIDWLDTPVTDPTSPEVLRARIGRLGVGGSILMDGEFRAKLESSWGDENQLFTGFYGDFGAIECSNGDFRVAYSRSGDYALVERVRHNGVWSSETVLTAGSEIPLASFSPSYIELDSGNISIIYRSLSASAVVQRTFSSSWSAESIVYDGAGLNPDSCKDINGVIRVAYRHYSSADSDHFIFEKIFDGTGWSEEHKIIARGNSPSYISRISGELRIAYTISGGIAESIWDGDSWADGGTIVSGVVASPEYIEDLSGNLRILYWLSSGYSLAEKKLTDSSWSDQVVVVDGIDGAPVCISTNDGNLKLLHRTTGAYLSERILQRYARIGAGIIESGKDANGTWYRIYGDGWAECGGAKTVVSSTIYNANIGTYGFSTYYGNSGAITYPVEFSEVVDVRAAGYYTAVVVAYSTSTISCQRSAFSSTDSRNIYWFAAGWLA